MSTAPETVKAVTVYCGSRSGKDPKWAEVAKACGREMARRGIALVFGGGANGLMGAVASGVIESNGKSTGVIPESLLAFEPAMQGLTELIIVDSMHTRKSIMSERGDAFLVLPGGIGTFEEFFETWTWHQLGFHNKPIVLLNAHGYYSALLAFLQQGLDEGFIKHEHHCHLRIASSVNEALDLLTKPC